jgi:hypothetical protein
VTLFAAAGVVLTIVVQMVALGTDASLYLSVGEDASVTRDFVQERLGETYEKPLLGHDGKFFFVQAQDPLILDPEPYREVLDRPVYRSQRVLYPLLAAPARVAGQWSLVWWMLGINVLSVVGGTYVTARVAERVGLSPWFGVAFTLNPGVWAEVNAGSAGALAWALAMAGILLYLEGRLAVTVALLGAAVLAREAMLLVVAGVAFHYWREHRRIPVALLAPLGAAIGWGLYVRARLGADLWESESQEFGLPLAGLVGAAREWITDSDMVRLAAGAIFVIILVRFVALALRIPHVLGWSVLGFAAIAPFFSRQVWYNVWDISRAVLPVATVFVLLAGLDLKPARAPGASAEAAVE